jgi:hypothetical protein
MLLVTGENSEQIKPVIAKLEASGLRAILDYAAEVRRKDDKIVEQYTCHQRKTTHDT